MSEPSRPRAPKGQIDPRVETLLRDPVSYPHEVEAVDREETHISTAFLTPFSP